MIQPAQPIPLRLLFAGFLLCVLLVGCGDTCFVIVGIFPAMSPGNPPACKLGSGSGTVIVHTNSMPATGAAPTAPNLQHVFVTLQGIDALPNELASEDSPDWQKLAPELETQPVQIDLMAASSVDSNSCARDMIARATVRAGAYSQVRLRLVSGQPTDGEPLPQHNECAGIGLNCVVAANGQKYALAFENGTRTLQIASDRIANGFFNVLPDTELHLSIEFNPFSSMAAPAGPAVQIAPVFSVHSANSCDSFSASQ